MLRRSSAWLFASVFLSTALAACGVKTTGDDNTGAGVKDSGTTYVGLAFTVVDPGYTSSSLYYYDLASGAITKTLAGQSGDPLVKSLGGSVYLFNRAKDSLNFLSVDPRTAGASPTAQVATSGAGLGDPHDVLRLSDGNLLLAQWAKGALVVVDPTSGAVVQTVQGAALDTSGNAQATFHPEAIWARTVHGADEVNVLHQSRDATGRNLAEGSRRSLSLRTPTARSHRWTSTRPRPASKASSYTCRIRG